MIDLSEALKTKFPRAQVQHGVGHKVRPSCCAGVPSAMDRDPFKISCLQSSAMQRTRPIANKDPLRKQPGN